MTSRPAPPPFEGCTLDGVRYAEDDRAGRDTPELDMGAVVALDAATGEQLWSVVLWTLAQELPGLIIPHTYLHRITPDVVPGRLRVADEYGLLYVVDLATRTARCLGSPGHKPRFPRLGPRARPPSPPPSSFEGRRYEQIMDGDWEGLGQRTGLLSVTDEASNQRIDVASLYGHPRREGPAGDEDDVFFVSAQLDALQRQIVIENERHERFAYRIDDGSVHRLT